MARGWIGMLWGAAVYNGVIAVASFFAPGASVTDRIAALLIGCFGLVYAMIARQPERLAQVLWVGVIGKLGVMGLVLPEVLAGRAAAGTGWVLAGDALFTLGFVVFLRRRAP